MPASGPAILQIINQGSSYDPEADLHASPLWPLHADLRVALAGVNDMDSMATVQPTVATIRVTFAAWRGAPSLTFLRGVIRSLINQTDVSDDPLLVTFKSQALASSHWTDSLPS